MPLHLTKIAFGAKSFDDIESWYAGRRSPHLTTKYRPTRWKECIGGSLYWIHQHNHGINKYNYCIYKHNNSLHEHNHCIHKYYNCINKYNNRFNKYFNCIYKYYNWFN